MLAKSITPRYRIRLRSVSFTSCSRLVGDDDHVLVADAACRDRLVACQELLEGIDLVGAGDEPDDAAGFAEGRIGEGHPGVALVIAGEGDAAIADFEDRGAGDEGGGVAVGAE